MNNILAQGAEAILVKKSNVVSKKRIKKGYRLTILDEKLRKSRTKKEFKLLEKAKGIIPVPKAVKLIERDKEIQMQFIKGKKLSISLDKLKNSMRISEEIGKNIAKLHDHNIIHGDLTTSNMIYSANKLYFIDFGLGYQSSKVEDKAVDLHLIKEALEAKHFKRAKDYFKAILKGYKISKNEKLVVKKLEEVEKRGRYKQSY